MSDIREKKDFVPHLEQKIQCLLSNDTEFKDLGKLSKYIGISRQALTQWWRVPQDKLPGNQNKIPESRLEKLLSAYQIHSDFFKMDDIEHYKSYIPFILSPSESTVFHKATFRKIMSMMFLKVKQKGIILKGPSGIGKSRLASTVVNSIKELNSFNIELFFDQTTILEYPDLLRQILEASQNLIQTTIEIDANSKNELLVDIENLNKATDLDDEAISDIGIRLLSRIDASIQGGIKLFFLLDDLKNTNRLTLESIQNFLLNSSHLFSRVLSLVRDNFTFDNKLSFEEVNINKIELEQATQYIKLNSTQQLSDDIVQEIAQRFSSNLVFLNIAVDFIKSHGYQSVREIYANQSLLTHEIIERYFFPHFISRLAIELKVEGHVFDENNFIKELGKLALAHWVTKKSAKKIGCESLFLSLINKKEWLSAVGENIDNTRYYFHDLIKELLVIHVKANLLENDLISTHELYVEYIREEVKDLEYVPIEMSFFEQYHLFHVKPELALVEYEQVAQIASDTHNLTLAESLNANIETIKLPKKTLPNILLRQADLLRLKREFNLAKKKYLQGINLISEEENPDEATYISLLVNMGVACVEESALNNKQEIEKGLQYLNKSLKRATINGDKWFQTISLISIGVGYQNLVPFLLNDESDKNIPFKEIRLLKAKAIKAYNSGISIGLDEIARVSDEFEDSTGKQRKNLKKQFIRFINVVAKSHYNIGGLLLRRIGKNSLNKIKMPEHIYMLSIKNYRSAMIGFEKIGNEYWEAECLIQLDSIGAVKKEHKAEIYCKAANAFQKSGHKGKELRMCYQLAKELNDIGEIAESKKLVNKGIELAKQMGEVGLVEAFHNLIYIK